MRIEDPHRPLHFESGTRTRQYHTGQINRAAIDSRLVLLHLAAEQPAAEPRFLKCLPGVAQVFLLTMLMSLGTNPAASRLRLAASAWSAVSIERDDSFVIHCVAPSRC